MPEDDLSLEELEELSYYDFMGYMDVPFFNIGGVESIDRLAELCKIRENSKVLEVGCGTGSNSCYLAQTYGCQVTGIDIAEHMIQKAQRRSEKLNLADRVTFLLSDAYHLKFPPDSFDVILTVFVSQFLDRQRAFPEFVRVLKSGGCLGINEMHKAGEVPPEAVDKVREGEQLLQEVTELPFTLNSPTEWRRAFEAAALINIVVEEYTDFKQQGKTMTIVKEFGGWGKIVKILGKTLLLAAKSKKFRSRFGKISRGKRVLLRDKIVTKYVGYILVVGEKP